MKYEVVKYPDGGCYVKVFEVKEVEYFKYRINSYEDLFILKSLKDALDSNKCKEVYVYITCMFQQQHDRRFNLNESFELKLVCDFINSCNFAGVEIFHPHSDVTPALLNRSTVRDNTKFIDLVINRICESKSNGKTFTDVSKMTNLVLMSTDAGGFKPLMKLVDKLSWEGEVYSASKSRKYENGESKLTQVVEKQDFGGKDILIIDDLCVNGGTFVGLAKILKTRNVGKLYLAVSHITIDCPSTHLEYGFETVFTTNSKYEHYYLSNIEVIKMFDYDRV